MSNDLQNHKFLHDRAYQALSTAMDADSAGSALPSLLRLYQTAQESIQAVLNLSLPPKDQEQVVQTNAKLLRNLFLIQERMSVLTKKDQSRASTMTKRKASSTSLNDSMITQKV